MRTFISIDMPKEIQKEIRKIQERLPEFKGKKTESENLHLTLKFLGEANERKIENIKERLRKVEHNSFETEIDSIGVFDNRKSKVYKRRIIVWLHLTNCEKLQKEIDEKLKDLFEKERRFMSHLTIARVKKVRDRKKFIIELKKIKFPKIKFKVDAFYLMESKLSEKGSKYSVIKKYKLER